MAVPKESLVTGHSSHEVFLVEEGKLRWVPDLWTMQSLGASPGDVRIVADTELQQFEYGEPVPSAVPTPDLTGVSYVESDGEAVFAVENGKLRRISQEEGELIPTEEGFDKDSFLESVVFLPMSLLRGFEIVLDEGGE